MELEPQEVYEARRMEVADYILEHPEEFNMRLFGKRELCGTVACIAGTAAVLAERQGLVRIRWEPYPGGLDVMGAVTYGLPCTDQLRSIDLFARDYLGLRSTVLFYRMDLTPERAAKELLEEPYITQ